MQSFNFTRQIKSRSTENVCIA